MNICWQIGLNAPFSSPPMMSPSRRRTSLALHVNHRLLLVMHCSEAVLSAPWARAWGARHATRPSTLECAMMHQTCTFQEQKRTLRIQHEPEHRSPPIQTTIEPPSAMTGQRQDDRRTFIYSSTSKILYHDHVTCSSR